MAFDHANARAHHAGELEHRHACGERQPEDPYFGTLAVEIRARGLSCDRKMRSRRGDGLDSFLASLATDWRGWDGTRTWHSLEDQMHIEATHHRNRVELLFIVWRDSMPDEWQVRFPILVAPGESLTRLAGETAGFSRREAAFDGRAGRPPQGRTSGQSPMHRRGSGLDPGGLGSVSPFRRGASPGGPLVKKTRGAERRASRVSPPRWTWGSPMKLLLVPRRCPCCVPSRKRA